MIGPDPTTRLVVIVPGVPHPTHGASRVLFWHYIAGLSDAGYRLRVVCLLEPGNHLPEDISRFRDELANQDALDVVSITSSGFLARGRLGARLRQSEARRARDAVQEFEHDAIVCMDLLAAQVARPLKAPKVVWLGDLAFQTQWHHARLAARERRSALLRLPPTAVRSLRSMGTYRATLADVEAIGVASKSSERMLGWLGLPARYVAYPWPEPATMSAALSQVPDRPTFLFFGTHVGLGSRSAFHFLLDELYPRLQAQWGDFRILIAGHGDPPPWALEKLAAMPELEILGFVDDLGQLLSRVHAALAPIDVPVGNRSRIVTAMAAGCLVVTHTNAALGNPDLLDHVTCHVADTGEAFADRMRRAVEDRASAEVMISAARASYEQWFEPTAAVRALAELVSAATESADRRPAGGRTT